MALSDYPGTRYKHPTLSLQRAHTSYDTVQSYPYSTKYSSTTVGEKSFILLHSTRYPVHLLPYVVYSPARLLEHKNLDILYFISLFSSPYGMAFTSLHSSPWQIEVFSPFWPWPRSHVCSSLLSVSCACYSSLSSLLCYLACSPLSPASSI